MVQLINGKNILLSRSGYTGEIGFEIYCRAEDTVEIWELLIGRGKGLNITPCGLAARDSLRAGAKLPLSHQDIGNWPFFKQSLGFLPSLERIQKKLLPKILLGENPLRNFYRPILFIPIHFLERI